MSKPTYCIPQPQRLRRIQHSFAWIDHRLLRSGFVQTMTHQDQSLYLFLALAADRNGVSFYRKEKICNILGLDFGEFEVARDRLINMGLLAFQPYSAPERQWLLSTASRRRQAAGFRVGDARCLGAAEQSAGTKPAAFSGVPDRGDGSRGSDGFDKLTAGKLPASGPDERNCFDESAAGGYAQSPSASVNDLASRLAAAFKTV